MSIQVACDRLTRIVSNVSVVLGAALVGDRRVGQRDEDVAPGEDGGGVAGGEVDREPGGDVEPAADDVSGRSRA